MQTFESAISSPIRDETFSVFNHTQWRGVHGNGGEDKTPAPDRAASVVNALRRNGS